MNDYKLTRDETETHISFTAQERIDGIIEIYTDDPVWIRKCESIEAFKDVGSEYGTNLPGRTFRSQNHTVAVSLRLKRQISESERERLRIQLADAREEKEGKGDDNE